MKAVTVKVLKMFLLLSFISVTGCGQFIEDHGWSSKTNSDPDKLSAYTSFAPEKVYIMPLTEFINDDNIRRISIKPYVSLLDSFGSQVKSPCVFRFELYQRALHTVKPKGKRVVIWQDIDLTDPAVNNEYWRDFLRAYEFDLPFELDVNQSYILQVTCMCPTDKRLSDEFSLKLAQ
jgi:hypothetical protein